jgi:hypothetical protein
MNFRVGQLLGFRGTQVLRANRFPNHRVSGSIWTVALGAIGVEQLLAVRLRCREMREGE